MGSVTLSNGSISGTISVTNGGQGYTTVPEIYIDEPTGTNPVKAVLQAVLTDGVVTSVNVLMLVKDIRLHPELLLLILLVLKF